MTVYFDLSKIDRRLSCRQQKKDEKFAPPFVVARELSLDEKVAIINARYIAESFGESSFEKSVRESGIVGVDDL